MAQKKRNYPSYTTAELEAYVASGRGDMTAIKEEIAARKTGTSQHTITPQIIPAHPFEAVTAHPGAVCRRCGQVSAQPIHDWLEPKPGVICTDLDCPVRQDGIPHAHPAKLEPKPAAFADVATELQKMMVDAGVYDSGGNVECVQINHLSGRVYLFGTANENWAADVFANMTNFEMYEDSHPVETDCPSDTEDAAVVALAIFKAMMSDCLKIWQALNSWSMEKVKALEVGTAIHAAISDPIQRMYAEAFAPETEPEAITNDEEAEAILEQMRVAQDKMWTLVHRLEEYLGEGVEIDCTADLHDATLESIRKENK